MGWFGYGIYDGDETQTLHAIFMQRAGYKGDIYDFQDQCLRRYKTILTHDLKELLSKNIDKILKRMPRLHPSLGFHREFAAVEWQMLLALFVDNNMVPPKKVIDNGLLATEYLKWQTWSFDEPSKRKAALNRFIKKVEKKYNVSRNP